MPTDTEFAEEVELSKLLQQGEKESKMLKSNTLVGECPEAMACEETVKSKEVGELQQWATSDGVSFIGTATCVPKLKPGLYSTLLDNYGTIHFNLEKANSEDVIRFPDGVTDKVLNNIQTFWEREGQYKENGLTFKRGILLWGPPGSGKTSTIRLIMNDVIDRNGIVIKFEHPRVFHVASKVLRKIEPDTPVVVILEDLDSILDHNSESEVINILDGVDVIDKVIFVATTNYPERLGDRVINRPSRFDRRYKVGAPNTESREVYFKHLFDKSPTNDWKDVNLDKWVEDTEGMSLAHLKELYVGVIVLGDEYDLVIEKLRYMSNPLSSGDYNDEDECSQTGFALGG